MADIDAQRPAQALVRCRLERQDREHAVDIGAHGARAAGSPGPHCRRDVIDDRNRRRARTHTARNAVGEIGAVDNDERVGPRGDDRVGGFANAPQDHPQACRYRADPDNGKVVCRKRTNDALSSHGAPTDSSEHQRAARIAAQCANKRGTERVVGFLGGDQIDRERSRLCTVHARASSDTPTKKILARSAAALILSGSATIALPAATASPPNPARATFSIVRGPIAGRSKRRSCPGLGALTRTPTPTGLVNRPSPRSCATRKSILSVPSDASTATT